MDVRARAAAAQLDVIALQAYADKASALLIQCAEPTP
jgi:hypothetical protein